MERLLLESLYGFNHHRQNGKGPSVKVISDRHGKFEVWERVNDGEFLLSRENFQKNFVKLSKTPGRV